MAEKGDASRRTAAGGVAANECALMPPSAFFLPKRWELATSCEEKPVEKRASSEGRSKQRVLDYEASSQQRSDEEFEPPLASHSGNRRRARRESCKKADGAVPIVPCCSASVTTRHLEDIVIRQAKEISGLQTTLAEERKQLECARAASESSAAAAEQRRSAAVKELEVELQATRAQLQSELARLRASYDRDTAARDAALALERETAQSALRQKDQQLGETLAQLAAANRQCEQLSAKRATEAREAEQVVAAHEATIGQLKAYLSQQQALAAEYSEWSTAKLALTAQVQEAQQARDSLATTVELLNVRLRALEEILALHEKELVSSSAPSGSNAVIDTQLRDGVQERGKNLLNRWREKVYELLVQRKSLEITARKEEASWKAKVAAVEHEVHASRAQCEVMVKQLEDKDAQLRLEKQARQAAERQQALAEVRASAADEERESARRSCEVLWRSLQQWCTWQLAAEKSLVENAEAIKVLCQRLHFAGGRIKMIEAYLVRKRKVQLAMQSGPTATTYQPLDASADDRLTATSHEASAALACCSELEKVSEERDRLVSQLQQDAHLFEQTVVNLKHQHALQLAEMQTKIQSLEDITRAKNEKLATLASQLGNCEKELEHARSRNAELEQTIGSLEDRLRNAAEQIKCELVDGWNEKLLACQRQLTDARAQLAKTEVSASRIERELGREQTRHRDELGELRRRCAESVERLEAENRSLQAERNMLMTTIRQEGLLSKLKASRTRPVDGTGSVAVPASENQDRGDTTLLSSVELLTQKLFGSSRPSSPSSSSSEDDESI